MRSLNSICKARDEARYVSRTWSNTPSAPDVSYPIHVNETVKSPDDIIEVYVANPNKKGWLMAVMMPRHQHEAEVKAMNDAFDAKQKARGL